MEARALVLGLSVKRMRDTPNTSTNSAYARPLPMATAPQAWTVTGLRLAGRAARRLAGMVPGTATATANLLTVMGIHTAHRARRPTGVTAPAARAFPVACLARHTAVRVLVVVRRDKRSVVRWHYVPLARRSSAAVRLPGARASSWHLFNDAHVTPVADANVPQLL
jgi:hypothetical protein